MLITGAAIAVAGALVPGLIALVGIWLRHHLSTRREDKLEALKSRKELQARRQQVIAQLCGAQSEAIKLCETYGEIAVQARVLQAGGTEKAMGGAPGTYEATAIALAVSHRRMFEALGTIATLFPNTGQLNRLMDRIRPQIPPIRYPPDKVTSPAEIRAWADSYAARLYGIPESQYRRPIDDLVGYLRRHIDESD